LRLQADRFSLQAQVRGAGVGRICVHGIEIRLPLSGMVTAAEP
jgi:hypothetical protein